MTVTVNARLEEVRTPGPARTPSSWGKLTTLPRRTTSADKRQSLVGSSTYGEAFMSVLESSGTGLAAIDPSLRIRESNNAFADQCAQPEGALANRHVADLLHPSVRQHVVSQMERLVERRRSIFVEHLAAVWCSQTNFSATVTGAAVHGPGGQVETIVMLVKPDETDDENGALAAPSRLLTKIDARILEGVAAGSPTVKLACRLFLSRQGVEYHVSNMLRRFKVPNRAALVSKAYSMGVLEMGSWPPKVIEDYVRA
jgi:DNA-binding CsgD family transcriptional regulator